MKPMKLININNISSVFVLMNIIVLIIVHAIGRTLRIRQREFSVVVERYERLFTIAYCIFTVIAQIGIMHLWNLIGGSDCKPIMEWILTWIVVNMLSQMSLIASLVSRRQMRYLLQLPILFQTTGWILYIVISATVNLDCGLPVLALFPTCLGVFMLFFVPQAFLINFDKIKRILDNKTGGDSLELEPVPTSFIKDQGFESEITKRSIYNGESSDSTMDFRVVTIGRDINESSSEDDHHYREHRIPPKKRYLTTTTKKIYQTDGEDSTVEYFKALNPGVSKGKERGSPRELQTPRRRKEEGYVSEASSGIQMKVPDEWSSETIEANWLNKQVINQNGS